MESKMFACSGETLQRNNFNKIHTNRELQQASKLKIMLRVKTISNKQIYKNLDTNKQEQRHACVLVVLLVYYNIVGGFSR